MRTLSDFSFAEEPGKRPEKPLLSNQKQGDAYIPAISVVTPYFNSETYFEQTFWCVMNQTFEDFEWVIVNDGSTRPEAVEKLKEFCAQKGLPAQFIHVESVEQAKALPCVFNNWAVFYDGKFATVNQIGGAEVERFMKRAKER